MVSFDVPYNSRLIRPKSFGTLVGGFRDAFAGVDSLACGGTRVAARSKDDDSCCVCNARRLTDLFIEAVSVREIIKDYGAAIGPTLAFILGFLALYGKYWFDQISSRWTVSRRIGHLQKLVARVVPPPDYFPRSSESGLLHADEARNLTNLSRFYSNLLLLKPVVEAVSKSIAEYGNEDQVVRFYSAKWSFDCLIRNLEKWREAEKFRFSQSDYVCLLEDWRNFTGELQGGSSKEYITLKDRLVSPAGRRPDDQP